MVEWMIELWLGWHSPDTGRLHEQKVIIRFTHDLDYAECRERLKASLKREYEKHEPDNVAYMAGLCKTNRPTGSQDI